MKSKNQGLSTGLVLGRNLLRLFVFNLRKIYSIGAIHVGYRYVNSSKNASGDPTKGIEGITCRRGESCVGWVCCSKGPADSEFDMKCDGDDARGHL
jgi:hypothetical protein